MSTSDPSYGVEDYHVAIICALDSELAAVEAMLDEEHEITFARDKNDNNCYTFGKIHKHNIVIACLPAGTDGLAAAATVAKDLARTFPQLRFGLMVGIGGGVPNLDKGIDIRLGDVVVSQPSGTNGGVVQYDKGKHTVGGQGWERKGSLDSPPTVLMTAVQKLKAKHRRTHSLMTTYINHMLERYPTMADNYSFSGSEEDVLYSVSTSHISGAITCEHCPVLGRVTRSQRASTAAKIHYGVIASGNSVIKDPLVRDFLRDTEGAMCIEMEAAGLMREFPCLVIRGISDYADSHKNNKWHEYAAAVAAAYAKELLSYVSAADTIQTSSIQDVTKQLAEQLVHQHKDISGHLAQLNASAERQISNHQSDKQRECHRVFKISDYERDMNRNPLRAPGTCEWVFQHTQFTRWLRSDVRDVLWISADPGCGKSVLARSLIEHDIRRCSQHQGLTICYYFFRDIEGQNKLSIALCAILHQLFTQQPWLITQAVIDAWQSTGNRIQQEPHTLWTLILSIADDQKMKPVYCILDALDECTSEDREALIQNLRRFHLDSKQNNSPRPILKILATSRPYSDIEYAFENTTYSSPVIRLRGEDANGQIHEEIDIVVRSEVERLATELQLRLTTRDELERRLLSMKHRTYLWLRLALGSIRAQFEDSLCPHEEEFNSLPGSVPEAYEQILSRVKDQERVRKILSIIVGATRALTVDEMALALNLSTATKRIRSFEDFNIESEHIRNNIRRWCELFIYVQHDRLYLMHQTAKEFLLINPAQTCVAHCGWQHSLRSFDVDLIMAEIFMKFLSLNEFQNEWKELDHALSGTYINTGSLFFSDRFNSFFLLAASSLARHWSEVEMHVDETLFPELDVLYDGQHLCRDRWSRVVWDSITPEQKYRRTCEVCQVLNINHNTRVEAVGKYRGMHEIHLVVLNNHTKKLRELLTKTPRALESLNGWYETPLIIATRQGSLKTVRILVEHGASIENTGPLNRSALVEAARLDHKDIVQYLIEHNAIVDRVDGSGDCALLASLRQGHITVVQCLLDHGANADAQGATGEIALEVASHCGYEAIVRTLIEHGADVDAQGKDGTSALMTASKQGYQGIIRLLLQHGANIDAQNNQGLSPLYIAAVATNGCNESIVRLLLEQGADVNILPEHYHAHPLTQRTGPLYFYGPLKSLSSARAVLAKSIRTIEHASHGDLESLCATESDTDREEWRKRADTSDANRGPDGISERSSDFIAQVITTHSRNGNGGKIGQQDSTADLTMQHDHNAVPESSMMSIRALLNEHDSHDADSSKRRKIR